MTQKRFCLEIRGDLACFTRPEMKVERVSYDVITPSAARAVFESILWKPQIRWHIRRIEILEPVRWTNLRRNEVGAVISTRNVQQAMTAGIGDLGMFVEEERQQRAALILRDVGYRVHADLEVLPGHARPGENCAPAKYWETFERRAKRGQCVNQPYLGCREFAARFRLVEPTETPVQPIQESRDLGWMLFDMDFSNPADPKPRFFRAELRQGVIDLQDSEVCA